MTPEQLAEIKARVAAATPGKLSAQGYNAKPYRYHTWRVINEQGFALAINCTEEDATLFACSRQDISALLAEVKRLQSGIAKIESRWREASQDKCFRSYYRGTMAECADELKSLLDDIDDSELEAEIDRAFGV